MKRYRTTREVLAAVDAILASAKPSFHGPTPMKKVVDKLYADRHYFWIGIYLVLGKKVVRQCSRGPVSCCDSVELGAGNIGTAAQNGIFKVVPEVAADAIYKGCFPETKSEIVVPIKIGTRVIGVIDVESDRLNAFGAPDRVLLKNVGNRLARFLTAKGKYLVRKAAEQAATTAAARRVAAGEGQNR